jgi:hypothetical protein
MSIPQEAGKVATSVVDGLKQNPSCLAALAVLTIIAVLHYFSAEREAARQSRRFDAVVAMLNRCYPEEGRP